MANTSLLQVWPARRSEKLHSTTIVLSLQALQKTKTGQQYDVTKMYRFFLPTCQITWLNTRANSQKSSLKPRLLKVANTVCYVVGIFRAERQ